MTEPMVRGRDVVWRLIDGAGLDHCRLEESRDGMLLTGVVVTVAEGLPVSIDYAVRCDRHWHTREVNLHVTDADHEEGRLLHLLSDGDGHWWRREGRSDGVRETPLPKLNGCVDVDLTFTPATNTLPVRRYAMTVGAGVVVNAAWVQFPSLELDVLHQRYLRFTPERYRYESYKHGFHATIEVDERGLVRTYQDLWEQIASRDFVRGEERSNA